MSRKKKEKPRLGKLEPRYTLFLNPYTDRRFTRCPECDEKTKERKLPLFIHVFPDSPISINFTCRYCVTCDLLIVDKAGLQHVLVRVFTEHGQQALIGNDYLVVGTIERADWREGELTREHVLDHLHDFKDQVIFTPER